MKKAAFTLPPVLSFVDGLPIYFLTGEKYLYQTLFCIRSLSIVSREKFRFILIDDGSFNQSILNKLIKLLPGALIVRSETIEQNIKERFAEIQFPVLNEKRRIYPHIKKLTDIHTLPGSEWKLVLDSDMLFWKEPVALIEWLKSPELPIHMIDCTNSYGYSLNLMEELSSCKIRPLINVGAIGINSNKIDWKAVEEWITGLEKKEGATYYLEQAISAMLIGDQNAFHLNNSEYIVNPDNEEVVHKRGTLHHYVDVSKKPYFNQLWKEFIDG